MPVKKTPAKKPTAKKPVAKKPITKKAPAANTSKKITAFEKKLDKLMLMLQKKLTFVKQVMELDFIKTILSSKIVEDTNKWVKTNLEQICKIIGWVALVFGWLGVLMTLWTIGVLLSYFGGWFLILLLLNLAYILIGMILWYGLINMKKRVPFFVTFTILTNLAYFVVAWIVWGFAAISSPRTILFYLVFMIYVLKNKTLFTK